MFNQLLLSVICLISLMTSVNDAYAQKNIVTSPPQTSLVVDAKTGKILYDKDSTTKIHPASLTKLMTLYLMFEALESGKLKIQQKLRISQNAEKMLPCKLGLKKNDYITVKDAILAIAIKSANDVSVAVAENINGTEAKFAQLMNIRAKQLGMKDSYFTNASGWHDPRQKTTARDLAKLSIAIKRDFPQYYNVFSKKSFVFRGNIIKGHNKVSDTYDGAEGLKTGFHTPAGYNLAIAATRDKKSLVAIVTGGKSAASRDRQMVKLLDKYFDQAKSSNITTTKPIITAKLAKTPAKILNKKRSIKMVANPNIKNKKKLIRT
jgi:D-alanyl-D-alanine carboxypeptidase (penicillin-binding protein 5/6)